MLGRAPSPRQCGLKATLTQDLIAATISVIAERGLERTSTFEIATAAGVTQGALPHHFASKNALNLCAATELVHSE